MKRHVPIIAITLLSLTSCSSNSSDDVAASTPVDTSSSATTAAMPTAAAATETSEAGGSSSSTATFTVEVWADNWSALYVNGELIGEDSVPITTERSFNAETFSFEAGYPFTMAIEAKDFKETDSGIEYIGEQNQQMGDGGLIAQVTDTETGEVVAVTDARWTALVVHRAPLNTNCEKDADPDATCEYEITETPVGWSDTSFDDTSWDNATEWTATEVGPKDGYDEITWDSSALLIWGSDLEVDNTILFRLIVEQ